jgi:hypothetical protein
MLAPGAPPRRPLQSTTLATAFWMRVHGQKRPSAPPGPVQPSTRLGGLSRACCCDFGACQGRSHAPSLRPSLWRRPHGDSWLKSSHPMRERESVGAQEPTRMDSPPSILRGTRARREHACHAGEGGEEVRRCQWRNSRKSGSLRLIHCPLRNWHPRASRITFLSRGHLYREL